MSYVLDNLRAGDDGILRCAQCETALGPADQGHQRLAGRFDVSLDAGQPDEVAPRTSRYVLRHYGCRSCGSVFDVEMVAVGDEAA